MLTYDQTLDAQARRAGPFCALVWSPADRRCEPIYRGFDGLRGRDEIEEARDWDRYHGEVVRILDEVTP